MDYWKKGNITTGWRQLKDGSKYDNLFPLKRVDYQDKIIIRDGTTDETVDLMKKVAVKYAPDTVKLAKVLKADTLEQTCNNIWDFLYHHIQYKLDDPTTEQLRTPARSWIERNTGIDCDCFSVFASSILINLGIPHKFRITKYSDSFNPDAWQHVYVIVPDESNDWIIDAVISKFNTQKPYSQKKDFNMSDINGINIAVLSGLGNNDANAFLMLNGIGDTGNEQAIKAHIQATLNIARENPAMVEAGGDSAPEFIKKLQYALDYWDNPVKRAEALEILSANEDAFNKQFGLVDEEELGRLRKRRFPLLHRRGRKFGEVEDINGVDDDIDGLDGFDADEEILGIIDEIQNEYELNGMLGVLGRAKKTRKERKAKRKARRQNFFKKVKSGLKKTGKFLMRFNPVMAPIRGLFLAIVRIGLFKIKERLKWAFANSDQLKKHGKSENQGKKAKEAYKGFIKLWEGIGGKEKALRKAILAGKKGNINGLTGLDAVLDDDDDTPDYHTLYGLMASGHFGNLGAVQALIALVVPIIVAGLKLLNKHKSEDDEEIDEGTDAVKNAVEQGADAIKQNDNGVEGLGNLGALAELLDDLADAHELEGTELGGLDALGKAKRKKSRKDKKAYKAQKKSAKKKRKADRKAKRKAKRNTKKQAKNVKKQANNSSQDTDVPEISDNTPLVDNSQNDNGSDTGNDQTFMQKVSKVASQASSIVSKIAQGSGNDDTEVPVDENGSNVSPMQQKSLIQNNDSNTDAPAGDGLMDRALNFVKDNAIYVAGVAGAIGVGAYLLTRKGDTSKTKSLSGIGKAKATKRKPVKAKAKQTDKKIKVVKYN